MKRNIRHFKYLKFILIIILILFILSFSFLFIIRRDQFRNHIKAMNINAGVHYKIINSFSNYDVKLNVPKQGTYYIFGDCSDTGTYRAFKNDFIKNDQIIYGKEFDISQVYWAIKIENRKIVESWSSYYPLKEEQLIEYTEKEQLKYLTVIKKFNKSKLIGYYKAK